MKWFHLQLVVAGQRRQIKRMPQESETKQLEVCPVRLQDAAPIWQLVRDSGVLDLNSPYCYLLLCRDHAETCLVARRGGLLAGFVTAYRLPHRPDTVFVWQIGVARSERRRGLGRRLLESLVRTPGCRGLRWLEATVTPSNTASRRLFETFAASCRVPCQIGEGFAGELFGSGEHEPEQLFRLGPWPPRPATEPEAATGGPADPPPPNFLFNSESKP